MPTESFPVDYLVKAERRPCDATIFAPDKEVGRISRRENLTCVLHDEKKSEWIIDPRVDGEIRPFSLSVRRVRTDGQADAKDVEDVLTIRSKIFQHQGRFYAFTNPPGGRPLREFLVGKQFICRLDGFPFDALSTVDRWTQSNIRRFRGVPVGEMDGLGRMEGHHVRLFSGELADIGLPLAAASYLLFST